MKKVALLGLLSVAVMASESGLYVGAEVATTKENDKTSTGIIASNSSTAYGIDVGYYFDANSRAYAFYQNIGKGDHVKSTDAYGAGYDYLFGTSTLKPFVGAIVGYSVYKNGSTKIDGLAYGGQVGVDYKVTSNISVDAGYRYLLSEAKYTFPGYTAEVTNFQSFFAGVNYKF